MQKKLSLQSKQSQENLDNKVQELMPLVQDNQRLKSDLKAIKQKEMMLMDQNEALELELRASK